MAPQIFLWKLLSVLEERVNGLLEIKNLERQKLLGSEAAHSRFDL